jgi:hypothetical protein
MNFFTIFVDDGALAECMQQAFFLPGELAFGPLGLKQVKMEEKKRRME